MSGYGHVHAEKSGIALHAISMEAKHDLLLLSPLLIQSTILKLLI